MYTSINGQLIALDPLDLRRGFVTIGIHDWRLISSESSKLYLFARGVEHLIWHIDLCIGVRCSLGISVNHASLVECNGAVVVTVSLGPEFVCFIVPLPPRPDDAALPPLPDRLPEVLPFAVAREVFRGHFDRGAEMLRFVRMFVAFGDTLGPPFLYREGDKSVWGVTAA